MDVYRADKSGEGDLLEPVVNEGADGLCASDTVGTARESVPVDIN
jgi:hypothetical protein